MEEQQAFYCRDGKVAKSLDDLALILRDMAEDEFSHHVNSYKNDFANWILHVLNDRELAGSVAKAMSKQEIILSINERIMRREVSDKLREYTKQPSLMRVDFREPQSQPEGQIIPQQAFVQSPPTTSPRQPLSQQPTIIDIRPATDDQQRTPEEHIALQEQKIQGAWTKREEDHHEHPYKYFTLREFIMGVLLGFVLGFVISKLIFNTLR